MCTARTNIAICVTIDNYVYDVSNGGGGGGPEKRTYDVSRGHNRYVRLLFQLYNKKNITRRFKDMNFHLLLVKTIFHSFAVLISCKILFSPLEDKIHIFAPLCNILYISLFEQLFFGCFDSFEFTVIYNHSNHITICHIKARHAFSGG